jgi:hypothetical protein
MRHYRPYSDLKIFLSSFINITLILNPTFSGWLMVVQLFVTLALIASIVGLGVIVALFLRYPLEIILRFEWHFCGFALVCNGLTG